MVQYFVIALIVYAVLPTALARLCGLGAISRLPLKGSVIITFDDGPDPRYTPRVLDILESAGVKACFFVIGEKARQHPDIMKKMVVGGHEIGSHGFRHRIPWLLGPVGTIREIMESNRAIEEITGSPPAAYRPPWGLLNLFSYICRLAFGQKLVLWSFMSWDWTRGTTTENIEHMIRKKLIDGSILIFHDSDTEPGASAGSPEKMISALPGIINEIKERGYKTTLLGEYSPAERSGPGRWMLKLWRWWDGIFRMVMKIRDVTDDQGNPTIFRISVRRYQGPGVRLNSGETMTPGEKICEVHINNEYMAKILIGEASPGRIGLRVAKELRRALSALAGHISRDPVLAETNFLAGITLLHRGTAAAGFTPVEIPNTLVKKVICLYQGMVLDIYHPSGKRRLSGKGDMSPKMVVMSISNLLSKYPGHPDT